MRTIRYIDWNAVRVHVDVAQQLKREIRVVEMHFDMQEISAATHTEGHKGGKDGEAIAYLLAELVAPAVCTRHLPRPPRSPDWQPTKHSTTYQPPMTIRELCNKEVPGSRSMQGWLNQQHRLV